MRILALSGSLRKLSSNTTLLKAAALLAREDLRIELYDGLAHLPAFNPDMEGTPAEPAPVLEFRGKIKKADGVIVSSPEYAHGVPGALKNALDWTVGSGEFVDKPAAVISASLHSAYAHDSLIETLRVMSARVVEEASVKLPLQGKKLDERGIAADPELSKPLGAAVRALADAVRKAAGSR